jgi:Transcriptional regulators
MNIKDIAKKAGVSKSAVSIALNNKSGISDETRERILKIVKEYGYKHRSMVDPDRVFGSVKVIRLLACMKSDLVSSEYNSTSFFSDLIHSVEKYSREYGYALVFSSADIKGLKKEVEKLEEDHASRGIILLGTNLSLHDVEIISYIQPNLVVLDNYLGYADTNFVVMDNAAGAYNATSYLLNLGHVNIGYVQSSARVSNFELRKEGFLSALAHHGINMRDKYFFSVSSDIEAARLQFRN